MTNPRTFRIKPFAALLAAAFLAPASHAASNIARDGSLGAGPTAALSATGIVVKNGFPFQTIAIPESYGQRAGTNVFHSFSAFSVGLGDGAVFTVNQNTANVISRVTGGQASAINGLLSLDPTNLATAPNFFLVNPAGVTFGAGAVVDVPAAFHVGTANYLKFPDGNFYADPATASTFSTAAPEAFGFLGTTRATVGVDGGAVLMPQAAQPLSVIGGDVTLDNGWVVTQEGGDVRVVALGQRTQEVGFAGALPAAYGNLTVTNGGYILATTSTAAQAGNIHVGGGTLSVTEGSQIRSVTTASGDAGSVAVAATGNVSIDKAFVGSTTYAGGNAGAVDVTANAGNIAINTGGAIIAMAADGSTGAAGAVTVGAASMTIDGTGAAAGSTGISNDTFGSGNAGSVRADVTGNLSILAGGGVSSSTSSSGGAGSVTVGAGSLTIDGSGGIAGISSDAKAGSTGNAGTVSATVAGDVSIGYAGGITSSTYGSGNAGAIGISAANLAIDSHGSGTMTGIASSAFAGSSGKSGQVNVAIADTLSLSGYFGGITTSTMSTSAAGEAGTVTVTAGNILALDNAQISSDTYGPGKAGSVSVTAGDIRLSDGGKISSQTDGAGNAGSVLIQAGGMLEVLSGAQIDSSTHGGGDAGSVTISANRMAVSGASADGGVSAVGSSTIAAGAAGIVDITVANDMSLGSGGLIHSFTQGSGNAGQITIRPGSLALTDGASIYTAANPDSTGNAGRVDITTAGELTISGGSTITSSTDASGRAGSVTIAAGSLTLDGGAGSAGLAIAGIASDANAGSTGDAGTVSVTSAGAIRLSDGGKISSLTDGAGHAGSVLIQAGGMLEVLSGAQIDSSTHGGGDAGSVTISANRMAVSGAPADGGVSAVGSSTTAAGKAGVVDITVAEDLSVAAYGFIHSATWGSGDAGQITIRPGSLALTTGATIYSAANAGSTGRAGRVDISTAGALTLSGGSGISSSTAASGAAGSVTINAGSVTIDGTGDVQTGISSATSGGGNAGSVQLTVANGLTMQNGAGLASDTSGGGDAGLVTVSAGSIAIDGNGTPTGINSDANFGSGGHAGPIDVTASGGITLTDGGGITSSTYGPGNAGTVTVRTGSLTIDSQNGGLATGIASAAFDGSSGKAGSVDLTVSGSLTLSGNLGGITTSTMSAAAGGDAGTITVTAGSLTMTDQAQIASETYGPGKAGSIAVAAADSLLVDGAAKIAAGAAAGSSGQTGNVDVTAGKSIALSNGGKLAVKNEATVADTAVLVPTLLKATAPAITLKDAEITAASTGNVAASGIQVSFVDKLYLDPSAITTSSNLGNGGPIAIAGSGTLVLENSRITTSVAGLTGNGGDIDITANTLLLQTGFIQANTAASNASGGNVAIDVRLLVPTGNTLFLGGSTAYAPQAGVFGFNVIQAAAPTGVSGVVQTTAPALDVSGTLVGLSTQMIDTGGLGRSPCQIGGGSSMVQAGRGGFAPSARDLFGPAPAAAPFKAAVAVPYGLQLAAAGKGCAI